MIALGILGNSSSRVINPRFCMALLMAMMVKDHGFSMIATVCSSWVFVSRSVMLGWLTRLKGGSKNLKQQGVSL